MPEARFLKIIIVVLLLLNLGTLGYLWSGHREEMRHRPPRDEHPGERRGAAAFLYEELQLSDAQESTYRKMRRDHHEFVLQIRDRMKDTKQKLYSLMQRNDTLGAGKAQAIVLLDSLAAQQRRIEEITYAHFLELRVICTPQQQKRFDEVIGDALEQMR